MDNYLYNLYIQHFCDANDDIFPVYDSINILSCLPIFIKKFPFVDRFNILNKYSNYNLFSPYETPDFSYRNVTFKQLCIERTEQLIERAKNKRIAVFWSGGLDSNLVLICLFMLGKFDITVLYTKDSIDYNNYIYYKYLLNNKKITLFEFDKDNMFDDICVLVKQHSYFFIDGQCANQFFSSPFYTFFGDIYDTEWEKSALYCYNNYSNYNKCILFTKNISSYADEHISIYKKYFSELGFKVNTFGEFIYVLTFCFRYNYVKDEFKMLFLDNYMLDNHVPFFDTIDMQNWAINNFYELTKDNIYTNHNCYKKEIKKILYDYDNDIEINEFCTSTHLTSIKNKKLKNHIITLDSYGIKDNLIDNKNINIYMYLYNIRKILKRYC